MPIEKSIFMQKKEGLESLRRKFKQYIVDDKIVKDLPQLITKQIETLKYNLDNFDFINAKVIELEGLIMSEEDLKNIVEKNTQFNQWTINKEIITKESANYLKKEYAVNFDDNNIVEYTFSRETTSKKDISSIIITVFPSYFYIKFGVFSQEIAVTQLLEEEQLVKQLKTQFQ